MQNENLEKRSGQIRRNPSRDNKNINQGQNYEKERVDNKTNSNGDAQINQAQFSGNENSMDGSGVSDTAGSDNANQRSGKTQQSAAGEDAGNEQAGSQGLQNSRGAQGSNSQDQGQQQQYEAKSGESSVGVENNAEEAGGGASYDANEQFDNDEDFGNSTRQ